MYVSYSLAHSLMTGAAQKVCKKIRKKGDIAAAEALYRPYTSSSIQEASIVFTENTNPELGSELRRLTRAADEAKDITELKEFLRLKLTMEASGLLRWMKGNSYYGTTVSDAYLALWEYEPILYAQLYMALGDAEFFRVNSQAIISRVNWMDAIRTALAGEAAGNYTMIQLPEKKASYTFSKFYMRVLLNLYWILKYTRGIAQPVKAAHNEDAQVYLNRIETLSNQVNSLREENERLQSKERKDMSSIVVPLERAISDKDTQIAELTAELELIREIQETITKQEDIKEKLLELPADNVLFVGGPQTLRSAVQKKHPAWKLLAPDEMAKMTPSNRLVFVYTDYISHKMSNLVRKNVTGDPMYCRGTNIERLEHSMREAYTLHMRSAR